MAFIIAAWRTPYYQTLHRAPPRLCNSGAQRHHLGAALCSPRSKLSRHIALYATTLNRHRSQRSKGNNLAPSAAERARNNRAPLTPRCARGASRLLRALIVNLSHLDHDKQLRHRAA